MARDVAPAPSPADSEEAVRAVREVVVVDAVRTGVGRGHPTKGQYKDVHPNELLGSCYRELLARTRLDPARVDDVITGCVLQYGEQSVNAGRNAWLQAGLPDSVPATTVDRQCGSGQQAVNFGTALIASGAAQLVVAGGVEHMGHVGFPVEEASWAAHGSPWPQPLLDHHELVPQGIAAERIADRWEIGRAEMDQISLESHQRAHRAAQAGRFDAEIVPVDAGGTAIATDQGIRPDTSLEALAGLRPAFTDTGRVTAGNASQISDGAAALLLADRETAEALGLPVRARIVDHVAVGVDPVTMLEGPIPATRKLLERNGLNAGDIDRFEVNEAFAAVLAMWQREIPADPATVNVNGGAIALGHPLGASGARLLTSLVHELEQSGAQRGVVTMCCRGGLGTATLLERVAA
jgi:acetyl-CoA acyltransferase